MNSWTMTTAASLAAVLSLAGCGSSDRPQTVPVSGVVTLNGGPWPNEGQIYFGPIKPAEGYPSRPGSARFGTDGQFEVQTFKAGDGLIPGTYSVRIESWKVPPMMDGEPGVSNVPQKYRDEEVTLPTLVVSPDDSPHSVEYDVSD